MQEAYDMSWAEFILRSIAFREEREFQMIMTRAGAYQSYCAGFAFSKKKPVSIDKFWRIGKKKKSKGLSKAHEAAFREADLKYRREKELKKNG